MSDIETLINYIMLSRVRGLGAVSVNRLIAICGSAEACFSMAAGEILRKALHTAVRSIKMFLQERGAPVQHKEADVCYPKEHAALVEHIIESGAIVAEYLPGTKPRSYRFPMRNSLIAAKSDILYVVDTCRNSGTTFTIESA